MHREGELYRHDKFILFLDEGTLVLRLKSPVMKTLSMFESHAKLIESSICACILLLVLGGL